MTKSAKNMSILVIFMKLAMFRASQTPPQPKTKRQTKYLDPRASHEKKNVFCKNHFFAEIFTFFETSKSKKSRSGRSGDVPNWTILGMYLY